MSNEYSITAKTSIGNLPLKVSDHGVSEAVYLDDPDGNGTELYWDRPKSQWPAKEDGSIDMYTRPLDLEDLLQTLE